MRLGLFPLNLVLFPHTRIPLHIFEPRYRTLVHQCMHEGSVFGVNLVEKGHLHQVGCTAKIVEITQEYEDGRMDIVIEGVDRFHLEALQDGEAPYFVGEAEIIEDADEPHDLMLVKRVAELYDQIIEIVYGSEGPQFERIASEQADPSFTMAPKCGLSLSQKQQLLELTSENSRLEVLLAHLEHLLPSIREAHVVQRIVRSDGYLPAKQPPALEAGDDTDE